MASYKARTILGGLDITDPARRRGNLIGISSMCMPWTPQSIRSGATKSQLEAAMSGHILAQGSMIGKYGR